MKQFTALQHHLLTYLADGLVHSYPAFEQHFKLSRTTLSKQMDQLIELGVPLKHIAQQGYQLAEGFQALCETQIRQQLFFPFYQSSFSLHTFAEIDSTNRFLKTMMPEQKLLICCAEKQTAGRGRFNREWISPFGENIYLSSRWRLDSGLSKLSGLSLVVGLAVINALHTMGIHLDIKVKWPNDLLCHHQKLCGILIEMVSESHGFTDVIIGIGLNVNMAKSSLLEKPWCSLYTLSASYTNRNTLIAHLLMSLDYYLHYFLREGFCFFQEKWQALDYLREKKITVSQSNTVLQAYAKGITADGQLCVIDEQGEMHLLSSGDTSLRI